VCCVGLHDAVMNIPMMDAGVREVDIRGIFRYRYKHTSTHNLTPTHTHTLRHTHMNEYINL